MLIPAYYSESEEHTRPDIKTDKQITSITQSSHLNNYYFKFRSIYVTTKKELHSYLYQPHQYSKTIVLAEKTT
ncbi:hypothetical protein AFLA_013170 [Aspergillus flavus NRRL3357]|nr:hypothetical protein AFLA_013170 [Aspergillus flavus NRRL3357]